MTSTSQQSNQALRNLDKELLRKLGRHKISLSYKDGVGRYYEVIFTCPFCEDSGFHLYVNSANGKWNCRRCGAKGAKIDSLYRALSVEKGRSVVLWSDQIYSMLEGEENLDEDKESLELPEHIEMFRDSLAWRYLLDRGLTEHEIEDRGILIGTGKYDRRVVFPDYFHGSLVYWVARSYPYNKRPRYVNPPVQKKLPYWLGQVIERGYDSVVITEGPISSIIAGDNAVATYSKEPSELIEPLIQAEFDRYYVAYDGDAFDRPKRYGVAHTHSTYVLSELLHRRGKNAYPVLLPEGHDPASLGRERFRFLLDSSKRFDWTSPLTWRLSTQ